MSDAENNDDVMDEWAEAMEEAGSAGDAAAAANVAAADNAQQVSFEELAGSTGGADGDVNMDVILDIPVTISMEVGRSKMNIRNLLHLNQGSVVELNRMAGEPLDVMVNGTLIAHGEVVVVNEKFGIRLTDIISPAERVKKLK
jgi:flagellar motor switch protein FliN/FliY